MYIYTTDCDPARPLLLSMMDPVGRAWGHTYTNRSSSNYNNNNNDTHSNDNFINHSGAALNLHRSFILAQVDGLALRGTILTVIVVVVVITIILNSSSNDNFNHRGAALDLHRPFVLAQDGGLR